MLLGFTVTNPLGESLYVSLTEPEKSGLIVRNIDGLGSPTATINMNEYATIDGSRFNSSRATDRTITIQLDYYALPTIEHSRRKAYKYFPAKGLVKLVFKTDYPIEYITTGYVESNVPTVFSQKSGCTITIRCPDPYFHSAEAQSTTFYSIEPLFEFPFGTGTSFVDNAIEFSRINTHLIRDIFYDGNQPVGFTMTIAIEDSVGDIRIENATTNDHMTISSERIEQLTGYPIHEGDTIVLTTVKGSKSLYLLRDEGQSVYNILGGLDEYTSWLILNPGYNTLVVEVDQFPEAVNVLVRNDILYEGI